jgi:cytochrome c oxidase subunit 2
MESGFPLFPDQASSVAARVDALYFFLVGVSAFFSVLIAALIVYMAVKYRRRSPDEVGIPVEGSIKLEAVWIIIPFILSMVMFVWGASVYFAMVRVPSETLQIYVIAKQWMWKFQHQDGQREINELHVPVGRNVKITAASEDVIHSFFVPAFRIKTDVVPGRYSMTWFNATKPGRYHLFCAEYCGTNHSGMTGWVTVMEPSDYQAWLSGGVAEGSLSSLGKKLFQSLACDNCHRGDTQGRGPVLEGLFGKPVQLEGGLTVVADENYLRESILNPKAKIASGFQPIMPTFQGLVSEEQLLQLIAYIRAIGPPEIAPVEAPRDETKPVKKKR